MHSALLRTTNCSETQETLTSFFDGFGSLITQYLGTPFDNALVAPDTEEVYVNPDLIVRLISSKRGRQQLQLKLSRQGVEAFLRAVATKSTTTFDVHHPVLATALIHKHAGKCRIQGFIPPITAGPAFVIRKPGMNAPRLESYVEQGALSGQGLAILENAARERKNIVVAGPTGSGKTTLCNAILQAITRIYPADRLVILEDTPELVVGAQDCLQLQTTSAIGLRKLVKYSLRVTPSRIIIGEVRDHAAKDLLDAWITGHPGGCGTVHGEDCETALERLSSLAREGARGIDQRPLVLRAVHLVVLISGFGQARRVRAIARPLDHTSAGFTFEYLVRS